MTPHAWEIRFIPSGTTDVCGLCGCWRAHSFAKTCEEYRAEEVLTAIYNFDDTTRCQKLAVLEDGSTSRCIKSIGHDGPCR